MEYVITIFGKIYHNFGMLFMKYIIQNQLTILSNILINMFMAVCPFTTRSPFILVYLY